MDIIASGGVSLISLVGLLLLHKKINRAYQLLDFVRQAQTLSPQDLINKLEVAGEEVLNALGWKQKGSEIIGKAFIKGIAETKHPVNSILGRRTPLIYSTYLVDLLFSNENRGFGPLPIKYTSNTSSKIKILRNSAPYFTLSHPDEGKATCLVLRNQLVIASQALTEIHKEYRINSLSSLEKILVWITNAINYFGRTQSKSEYFFKGIPIGYVEREYGIFNGTFLIVLGEFVYDKLNKTLKMNKPKSIIKNIIQFEKELRGKILQKQLILLLLYIPFIVSSVLFIKKALVRLRQLKIMWNERATPKDLGRVPYIKTLNSKCSRCQKVSSCIVLKPCLHLCLCKGCSRNLPKNECPECSRTVSDFVEIFIS